jgi:uncharacterized repeat protein (TIGR03847 family)
LTESSGFDYDLDRVTTITVGAVGPPGQRTFYLQASKDQQLVSVIIEKEHAAALAEGVLRLLAVLRQHDPKSLSGQLSEADQDMELIEPLEARFRAGQLGMAFDGDRGLVVVVMEGATEEASDRRTARVTASIKQMVALGAHAMEVISQGRPTCVLCGAPVDPDGHACVRHNGHRRIAAESG